MVELRTSAQTVLSSNPMTRPPFYCSPVLNSSFKFVLKLVQRIWCPDPNKLILRVNPRSRLHLRVDPIPEVDRRDGLRRPVAVPGHVQQVGRDLQDVGRKAAGSLHLGRPEVRRTKEGWKSVSLNKSCKSPCQKSPNVKCPNDKSHAVEKSQKLSKIRLRVILTARCRCQVIENIFYPIWAYWEHREHSSWQSG